jgi:hypothetical protein
MKIRAMVLGPVQRKEMVKDKVKYPQITPERLAALPDDEKWIFHTLNVIDADAPGSLQKTLILDVHEHDLVEASTLAGKTSVLNIYAAENKKQMMRMYFFGIQQAVAVQKAN